MSSRSSCEGVEAGGLDGEVVVELGEVLALDLLDVDLEDRVLAGELGRGVVGRERQLDLAVLARARAGELLLEAGDEPPGPELDELVAPLAALERDVVDRALVVHDDEVAVLGRLLEGLQAREALAQRLDLAVDRRRRRPVASRLPTSTPLYSPSSAFGRTPISIENVSGSPSPGMSPTFSSGSPTGAMPASSIAATYQRPSEERIVSSSTASRPMRRMTTGGGTLPLRNPGMRSSDPSDCAVWLMRFVISSGETSASTRTRDSGSSVTVVFISAHDDTVTVAMRLLAWIYTGPVGHLYGGVADWTELMARYLWARFRGRRLDDAWDS